MNSKNGCPYKGIYNFISTNAAIFCLLFLLAIFHVVKCRWEDLEEDAFKTKYGTNFTEKFYYYDKLGNLIVNGSIPGNSSAITIDFKKYYPTCATNVYFNFIFYFDPSQKTGEDVCQEGMTICYEGQLTGEHMRPEFDVPNIFPFSHLDKSHEYDLFLKCKLANGGQSKSIRGLNVALIRLEDVVDIKSLDPKTPYKGVPPKDGIWHFFVISSSFFEEKYYYRAPEDGTMVLQIGQSKNMDVRVTDSTGDMLALVEFKAGKSEEKYGGITEMETKPDMNNRKKLAKFAGLWLLYLDFKTDYQRWQTISVVNPSRSQCKLMLEIRGNRMRPCRSYFEDIAVLEPVDANVKMIYTSEVGTIRTQKYGQEDVKATSTRWQKEQLRQSTTIDNTESTEEEKTVDEDIMREVTSKEKTVMTQHINKGESEISLNANPQKAVSDQAAKNLGQEETSGANARVGAKASYENIETEFETTKDVHEKTNIHRDKTNAFTNIKRSSAMIESFKSTSGAAESMEQGEFLQTSNAFMTREVVDIRVALPRNKKLVIKQLFFDCDGNVVKMPFILYTDGKERLKLTEQNASPKIQRPLSPSWTNETSESNLPERCETDTVSETESNGPGNKELFKEAKKEGNDFDDFMTNYED